MSAKSLVVQLVEAALQRGAHGAQASLKESESTDVSYENSQLKSTQSAQRTEISLKVIVNNRAGSSSSTDLKDIEGLVQRALEAAQFGSPVYYDLPGQQPAEAVKLYDPAVPGITRQEMVGMGVDILEAVNEYNPEILVNAELRKETTHQEYANSNGAFFADDFTSFNLGAWGLLVRGTDIYFTGKDAGGRSRQLDHGAITQQIIANFKLAELSAEIESGQYPVIFSPDGLIILLLTLILGLDGKNVVLGASPLSKRLGDQIADERFTLIDNPLIDFSPASSRFDDEGVPRQVTTLIENGVVRNFLYDLDSAGKAGTHPTGHGPGPRPTNWVVSPGDVSFEQMIKNTRAGLLVNSVLGLGQGNPMNGEFSLNVQEGYKIEDGALVGRVKDIMLSGNVYDVLKNIIAIGNRPEWVTGWLPGHLPYLQAGGLSVTAK
jgi:PmbA protein